MSPGEVIEILLAEDNEDDVFLIQEALTQEKLVNIIQVVRDGEEAMAYLRRQGKYKEAQPAGLLLLDINMPKKNGFEVLKEIKSDPVLKSLPVIILTTSKQEEDVARSYASGACSFISKPVSIDQMRSVLKTFALYWALVSRIPKPQP